MRQPTANWIGYLDTLMAYYLGINISSLSDERWAEVYAQLQHIRKQEANAIRHRK